MIRRAEPGDIPALVEMGRRFHEASGIAAPYCEQATGAFLKGLMGSPDGAVFITEGGMIGGVIAPAYCTTEWKMAVELFWWAEDRQGIRLLGEFERWAAEKGANEVRMTTLSGLEAAERILERRGYAPREISHTKVI